MSAERVNPFADASAAPIFEPKPRPTKPVKAEHIEHLAREHDFPSRQAVRAAEKPARARRPYKTGRNQQLNIKATAETIERFYMMADKKGLPLGEVFELALSALERSVENKA